MNEMTDHSARRIVEALRSGIASREVGRYFSSARPALLRTLENTLDSTVSERESSGMIVLGKYGEGKTHLLNTVISMADERNMAVSLVTLSKETPIDKLQTLYPKILGNTYLPGRAQPGFSHVLDGITAGSPVASAMYEYALTALETDKLYYLLKACLGTNDEDERFLLRADLDGDFISSAALKKIFKRIYKETVRFNKPFSRARHTWDYIAFISRLFKELGYGGWALLFDETELIGRTGKNTRLKAYANIADFLKPDRFDSVFTMFAFNSVYIPEVIEAKDEFKNLDEAELSPETKTKIAGVLGRISDAPQLVPLGRDEIADILKHIVELHARAYGWKPEVDIERVLLITEKRGHLLRTRIRTAIELLDQLYQYGAAGDIRVGELGSQSFEEEREYAPGSGEPDFV
ncbi:MAG: ATP-binding protein [Oscillospiraceae bacterium]|jgi:hypothetical protein|nr:ATP-binding protein [Oscillospiraceae bacterium]